jgi:hypothetical protein
LVLREYTGDGGKGELVSTEKLADKNGIKPKKVPLVFLTTPRTLFKITCQRPLSGLSFTVHLGNGCPSDVYIRDSMNIELG